MEVLFMSKKENKKNNKSNKNNQQNNNERQNNNDNCRQLYEIIKEKTW